MNSTQRLSQVIESQGGLASAADLARRWGIARSTVSELTSRPDFPPHVKTTSGKRLWPVAEADAYRATLPRARLDSDS
jgi:predicted DNA-binding transcriptional regulator AlpA